MKASKHPGGRGFIRVLRAALRSLDTPRALGIHLLLVNGEWDQLSMLEVGPDQYLDTVTGVFRYWKDAQAAALVRKVPWPTSFSRRKRALDSFDECERKCAETNHLMQWVMLDRNPKDPVLAACRQIVDRAKKLARYILGPLPLHLEGRFGPGTVFELEGSPFATIADKVVQNPPYITRESYEFFRHSYSSTLWERERMRVGLPYIAYARGNRFTTVPKDGKTDRGICVEPSGNIWMQLAVGDAMKDRLSRVGLKVARNSAPSDPIQLLRRRLAPSVRTGQDIHRELAEEASRDGSLATIDLSCASDTVSREVVRAILPPEWFTLLDCLRSPLTRRDGAWVRLEKFSSMGNGFTFELETLVFACLLHGVRPELEPGVNLYVYGDDIIVPTHTFADCIAALKAFGFSPNRSKSFGHGRFRESCGGDYFCGFDVRPFFVKDFPSSPLEWMDLHNGLRRARLLLPSSLFTSEVPAEARLFGPPNLGGTFWHSDDRLWKAFSRPSSPHVVWVRRLIPLPLKIPLQRWGEWSHYLLALIGASSSGLTPPRNVVGFKRAVFSIS